MIPRAVFGINQILLIEKPVNNHVYDSKIPFHLHIDLIFKSGFR